MTFFYLQNHFLENFELVQQKIDKKLTFFTSKPKFLLEINEILTKNWLLFTSKTIFCKFWTSTTEIWQKIDFFTSKSKFLLEIIEILTKKSQFLPQNQNVDCKQPKFWQNIDFFPPKPTFWRLKTEIWI